MRVAEDGSTWLGEGGTLNRIEEERGQAIIDVPAEPDEKLGSFFLVPDGFVAAIYQPSSGRPRGRVTRLDAARGVM